MIRKLLEPRIWRRIYEERLGEPLIYNVASAFVALFGSITQKIDHDLIPRQPYAFGMLKAFQVASRNRGKLGIKRLVFVEFGVASGGGLLNICRVGARLSEHFGIPYHVVGFDTGSGMPAPVDYRDHPELYLDGDFKPNNPEELKAALPDVAKLLLGPISQTLPLMAAEMREGDVLGFVSVDVDFWSSTVDCYRIFDQAQIVTLPMTPIYLDDVQYTEHHPFAGELLATDQYNEQHDRSKITPMRNLRNIRIFKRAKWLDQMYWFINLDSPYFSREMHSDRERVTLSNAYLSGASPGRSGLAA